MVRQLRPTAATGAFLVVNERFLKTRQKIISKVVIFCSLLRSLQRGPALVNVVEETAALDTDTEPDTRNTR